MLSLVILTACGGGLDGNDAQGEVDAAQAADGTDPGREMALAVMGVSKKATGFAAGVTGGAGGEVVRVRTAKELAYQLCRSTWVGCTDNAPRVIEIDSTIDMVADEPVAYAPGCVEEKPAACPHPYKQEVMLIVSQNEAHRCAGNATTKTYAYKPADGLLVGSNKTIVGIGNKAGIKGRGLMLKNDVKNIIIRNLAFTDMNYGQVFGGDAIVMWGASKVWIDHNYFARIGRQMIVTAFGNVDGVTISNNEFDGRTEYRCDGSHYWNFLLVAPTGNVSFVGNWIHDFSGRAPSLGGKSFYQFANNLFERTPDNGHAFENGHDGIAGEELQSLIEGNYFLDVTDPVGGPAPFYGLWKQTAATQAACSAALGRYCTGNIALRTRPLPSNVHAVDKMRQDSVVLGTAKGRAAGLVKPYSASNVPATVRANAGVGRV